jgi:hypothetical protein
MARIAQKISALHKIRRFPEKIKEKGQRLSASPDQKTCTKKTISLSFLLFCRRQPWLSLLQQELRPL